MTQSTQDTPPTGHAVKMPSPPSTPPTAAVDPTLALSSNEAETMPQLIQDERPTGNTVKALPPPAPPTKAMTPEPQILPVLSQILYLALQAVTDAELDMTVGEWI
jgi:hypothetical protein